MRLEITSTGDGSSTLFHPAMNEHYHSTNGAVQESMHVFISAGLNAIRSKNIAILEMGFGTGLNTLLTLMNCQNFNSVSYHAVEKYPLKRELVNQLNYETFLGLSEDLKNDFMNMHRLPWDSTLALRDNFVLHKTEIDFTEYSPSEAFDLIYYDAFAPEVQPELWEESIFVKLFHALKPEGILVTYCAKGEVRRRMQHAGFNVERLPGPPGKREMIRAVRL